MPLSVPKTPAAWGDPLFNAEFKLEPSDFQVAEQLDIAFDGIGEHLYLHIEKTSVNTDEVAELLALAYAVDSKAIGFAGMKDRHAVTSQWFSITTPANEEAFQAQIRQFNSAEKSLRILEISRHTRKLRRGAHSANRFVIRLKQVESASNSSFGVMQTALDTRIESIATQGFPNYIGPQRFGFGGQNLTRAQQWFKQPKKRASRQQRSLWLSAVRSALFNLVCAKRVQTGSWQNLLNGEPAILNGSNSFFDTASSDSAELQSRVKAFDIHPSAPWWGRGSSMATGECSEFEESILADLDDCKIGLERAGLKQERRAIRAQAIDLNCRWINESTIELSFLLSPGVFATTLLSELGVCREPDRRQPTNNRVDV